MSLATWEFFLAREDTVRRAGETYTPWGIIASLPQSDAYRTSLYDGPELITFGMGILGADSQGRKRGVLEYNNNPMTAFPLPDVPSDELMSHRFLYGGAWWEFKYRIVKYN